MVKNWPQNRVFLNLLKNLVIIFSWIWYIMKVCIIGYIPTQISYLGKILFLRNGPKYSRPIRLQNFWIKCTFFFYKQHFFSTQPQCCLTISWIEPQMLLRCCLAYTIIIMLRHILHLVYLCPCPDLGLFMSYLCDIFFIFSLTFIKINIILLKQTQLFFAHF